MASVAERVTARALGLEAQVPLDQGQKTQGVREPLENQLADRITKAATA
jgi:hypothetical protein